MAATDVPLNSTIWLYLRDHYDQLGDPELDGTPLPKTALPYAYAPGLLAPNTEHVIRIPVSTPLEDGAVSELTLTFVTGTRTAATALKNPSVGGMSRLAPADGWTTTWPFPPGSPERCGELFSVRDCFDTGVTLYAAQTADQPLAWLVDWTDGDMAAPRIHPDTCGPPIVAQVTAPQCTQMRAILDGGIATAPVEVCPIGGDAGAPGAEAGPLKDAGNPPGAEPRTQDASPIVSNPRPDAFSAPPESRARDAGLPSALRSTSRPDASGCSIPGTTPPASPITAWFVLLGLSLMRGRRLHRP